LPNRPTTFQAARNFPAGYRPSSVAVGDFNGDGRLDYAVTNYASNTVSVLLGNGDGSIQAARNFSGGSYRRSVAVRDFSGDGILDLAVADGGYASVSILLGNGDGTFQAFRYFNAGAYPSSVAVGISTGTGASISPSRTIILAPTRRRSWATAMAAFRAHCVRE
jgi:hypothetical protein